MNNYKETYLKIYLKEDPMKNKKHYYNKNLKHNVNRRKEERIIEKTGGYERIY
jgi:hypothetical protein